MYFLEGRNGGTLLKVSTIMSLLDAKCFTKFQLDDEIESAFACDLMSDVLAYVNQDILLITGLAHVQTLRTAEMLDIKYIVFVRGKQPNQEMIELAKHHHMILLGTHLTMYEASGILYQEGLVGLQVWWNGRVAKWRIIYDLCLK